MKVSVSPTTLVIGPLSQMAVSTEWLMRSPVTPEPATSLSSRHNVCPPVGRSGSIVQSCR